MSTHVLWLSSCLLALAATLPASAKPIIEADATGERPKLVFSCPTTPGERGFQYFERIHRELFDEMGYDFELRSQARQDVIRLLKEGAIDGDCGRHKRFVELSGLDNVVRSNTPLRSVVFSLWQREGGSKETARSQLTIAHQKNLLFLTPALETMGFKSVVLADSSDALIRGLIRGDFDAFVHYDTAAEANRKTLETLDIKNQGQVISLPIYTYFQKKHKGLLKEYSERLKRKLNAKPFKPPHDPHIPTPKGNEILFTCSIPADSPRFRQLSWIYGKVFKAQGHSFKMVSVPRARESVELKRQRVSGSCARAVSFIKQTPNIVGLDVHVANSVLQLWSRTIKEKFSTLGELPTGSSLAYVRGTHAIETLLASQTSNLRYVEVPNTSVGIRMLDAGRLDYFVGFRANTAEIIHSLSTRNDLFVVGELEGEPVHPILTEHHSALREATTRLLNELVEIHSATTLVEITPDFAPHHSEYPPSKTKMRAPKK
ncbi:MAG: hypothetical protein ACRBBW_12730 [Cellvibrionaceae bacterium]